MTPPAPRPIVLLGPTAGGKSELAVALAEGLRSADGAPGTPGAGGEVINADSMQVYRHLDAGTAKPAPELRARVPHHLIDLVEPTERFTVADWLARAEALLADLRPRGVWPIVVGGTNLYLKALLEGLFAGPPMDAKLREELAAVPGPELHQRLAAVDPAAAARIHPNDRKKLIRALEVFHLTGKPISAWQTQWDSFELRVSGFELGTDGNSASSLETRNSKPETPYRHNPILLGLDWPVEAINSRINQRVKAMFYPCDALADGAAGVATGHPQLETRNSKLETLPDEVRRLEAAGLLGPQAREALGYKQVLQHLRGACTLEQAFEKTKIETRRYAKQQRTWLKRYRGVRWLPAEGRSLADLAAEALAAVRVASAG